MRLIAAFVGLAVLAAPSAFAGPAQGGELYEQKCKMCHASGMANAPLTEKLAALDNDKIVQALTTPVPMMQGVTPSLSEQDKRDIAVFLTKKSMPAKGDLPEVKAE